MASTIRPATFEDLPDVSDVHVRVWQQAYPGQIDQAYLDGLNAEERLQGWQSGYAARKNDPRYGLQLAHAAGRLAGFMAYGPARKTEDRKDWLEIYAVNVLKEHWAAGVGYSLFKATGAVLRGLGARQTFLWVLDTNENALKAYARWGGRIEHGRAVKDRIGSADVTELSVLFDL